MNFQTLVNHRKEYCEERLQKLQSQYPVHNKEKIYCYTKNGKDYWRVVGPDGRRHHLPKEEAQTAVRIITDQMNQLEIQDLESEIAACRLYLEYLKKRGGKREKKLASANAAFRRLLAKAYSFEEDRLRKWQNAPYEKSSYHSDQLKIKTSQGFLVRSKAEVLIAEVLYRMGIPCRYEPVIYLNGERLIPDFMIMNPVTFEILYIEYNGMMDVPAYIERYLHKTEVYLRAGIIPDIHILYFHETDGSKIDMQQIQSRITEFVFGAA